MSTRRSLRPTPATAIGGLALFVALSGTGYAAASAIDGHDLMARSVGHKKIIMNSLTGAEIDESTLFTVPQAKQAGKAWSLPQPVFHPLAAADGWVDYDAGLGKRPFGWTRDLQGYVHLEGRLEQTGDSPVIGELPATIAPGQGVFIPVWAEDLGVITLWIGSDGGLYLFKGGGWAGSVSLDGVTYRP
jgi:hypothetical protein